MMSQSTDPMQTMSGGGRERISPSNVSASRERATPFAAACDARASVGGGSGYLCRMKRNRCGWVFRWCCLALAFAPALPVLSASEPGLPGDYDDQGEIVSGRVEDVGGVVSLRALLALDFSAAGAHLLHARRSVIHLEQTPDIVEITARDTEGETAVLGRWHRGGGYVPGEARAQLSLRDNGTTYVFTFEPTKDGALLRLTARREKKSVFGPAYEDIGVFVFARRS